MPFVYRIHEDPDEEKMYEFSKFVHNLGLYYKGKSRRSLQESCSNY